MLFDMHNFTYSVKCWNILISLFVFHENHDNNNLYLLNIFIQNLDCYEHEMGTQIILIELNS